MEDDKRNGLEFTGEFSVDGGKSWLSVPLTADQRESLRRKIERAEEIEDKMFSQVVESIKKVWANSQNDDVVVDWGDDK